jgi:hypothetical protein
MNDNKFEFFFAEDGNNIMITKYVLNVNLKRNLVERQIFVIIFE